VALVLSGGMGLGSYHAGVFTSLVRGGIQPQRLAGSSIGAITSALIAGTPPHETHEKLRSFWSADFDCQSRSPSPWRHLANWSYAVEARMLGVPGHFRPRFGGLSAQFSSLYDLAPMRDRLKVLLDFGRLNGGDLKVCIATTDIERGDLVIFDTAKGDEITMDHLLASCGYIPEFAPVEIKGRWLGDGALSVNTPFDSVLEEDASHDLVCFIVDLYARDGKRPSTLEMAFARRSDLSFANQTWQRLQDYCRWAPKRNQRLLYLSYRPSDDDAGPQNSFDYSPRSVMTRWKAGEADARVAVRRLREMSRDGLVLETVRL
jgi:NTE family protein